MVDDTSKQTIKRAVIFMGTLIGIVLSAITIISTINTTYVRSDVMEQKEIVLAQAMEKQDARSDFNFYENRVGYKQLELEYLYDKPDKTDRDRRKIKVLEKEIDDLNNRRERALEVLK